MRTGKLFVYAIYPFDSNGNFSFVYVGSSSNPKRRIEIHVNNRQENDPQKELHELMRENGFTYQILEVTENAEAEYNWIDFFVKKTNLTVFNTRNAFTPDYHDCYRCIDGIVLKPVFVKGGVVWKLADLRKYERRYENKYPVLREEMARKGITIKTLCEMMNHADCKISVSHLSLKMVGKYDFSIEQAQKIKEILGVYLPLETLFRTE